MKKTFKYISIINLLLAMGIAQSQVLITKDDIHNAQINPDAILEVRGTTSGILMPRVPLASDTDASINPVHGLTVMDTNTNRLYFWDANLSTPKWVRNFEIADAEAMLQTTTNYSSNTSAGLTVSTWSGDLGFTLGSGTSGWTDLNLSVPVVVTEAVNDVFISGEGMAMLNNTSGSSIYSFAIGLFVDGQLKVVRKFIYNESSTSCSWKKFGVNGLFRNLTVGTHTAKLYAINLTKSSSTNFTVTYGSGVSGCNNMNENMARIFLTAQLTQ